MSIQANGSLLSDKDILSRMQCEKLEDRIVITPIINPELQLGPDSFDLRLGTEFISQKRSVYTSVDPISTARESRNDKDINQGGHRKPKRIIKTHSSTTRLLPRKDKPFVLHPNDEIVACTLEYVSLPDDISAQLSGRSTWSREGLGVHSTAPNIHASTSAFLTFELTNNATVPIELYPGMRIAQLTFFQTSSSVRNKYEGEEAKYEDSLGAKIGRYWEEEELRRIQ